MNAARREKRAAVLRVARENKCSHKRRWAAALRSKRSLQSVPHPLWLLGAAGSGVSANWPALTCTTPLMLAVPAMAGGRRDNAVTQSRTAVGEWVVPLLVSKRR